jgi:hypothetical protein
MWSDPPGRDPRIAFRAAIIISALEDSLLNAHLDPAIARRVRHLNLPKPANPAFSKVRFYLD